MTLGKVANRAGFSDFSRDAVAGQAKPIIDAAFRGKPKRS